MQPMPGWLRDETGARTPVRPEGTLVGSSSTCNVFVEDVGLPPRHALFLPTPSGTELVVIDGDTPTINGEPASLRQLLADGDVIVIAGRKLVHEWTRDAARSGP